MEIIFQYKFWQRQLCVCALCYSQAKLRETLDLQMKLTKTRVKANLFNRKENKFRVYLTWSWTKVRELQLWLLVCGINLPYTVKKSYSKITVEYSLISSDFLVIFHYLAVILSFSPCLWLPSRPSPPSFNCNPLIWCLACVSSFPPTFRVFKPALPAFLVPTKVESCLAETDSVV